jgi:hypothetical protein
MSRFHSAPSALTLMAAVGVSLLAAPDARAGNTVFPGANCSFEGPAERPVNGSLLNLSSGVAYTTKLHCPVPHRQSASAYGGTLSVTMNARLNYSGALFECVLRSVLPNGTVHDSTTGYLPPKSANNGGFFATTISVSMPVAQWASVQLRCNVPNEYGGDRAGIVSYRVDD